MAHAFHPLRGTLRGHVQLPPPAPLPRLLPLPSFAGDAPVDDSDPTRPWVEGLDEPPTVPNTPHTSWVVASLPREDVVARNAPTVRPPRPPASRLRLALHGFAAGVTCGAIG